MDNFYARVLSFLNLKYFFLACALFTLAGLATAFFSQYVLEILPCPLCIYMRTVFALILIVSIIGLNYPSSHLLFYLLIVLLVIAFGMSIHHMGVEQKWWLPPESCRVPEILKAQNIEELRQIMSKFVPCDKVAWRIFGISVVVWNTIALLGLILLGVLAKLYNQKVEASE